MDFSAEILPDLLGAEGANSVESEAEDKPILFSQSHIESVVLHRHSAAIPRITQGHGGANQRV